MWDNSFQFQRGPAKAGKMVLTLAKAPCVFKKEKEKLLHLQR
jgi:hypothetical protein